MMGECMHCAIASAAAITTAPAGLAVASTCAIKSARMYVWPARLASIRARAGEEKAQLREDESGYARCRITEGRISEGLLTCKIPWGRTT